MRGNCDIVMKKENADKYPVSGTVLNTFGRIIPTIPYGCMNLKKPTGIHK